MKAFKFYLIIIATQFFFSCNKGTSSSQEDLPSEKLADSTLVQPAEDISKVVGIGLIVPESLIADLSAKQSAMVTELYKKIGDYVSEGEPIIQLEDLDEQLAIRKLKQQIVTQTYQVKVAESDLTSTRTQLEYKNSQLETSKILLAKDSETRENTESLENDVNTLEATLSFKKASLEVARSLLASLEIDMRQAENNIEKKLVRAPAGGQILDIDAILYSWVNQNETLVSFAADGPVVARCEIDEMFAGKVHPGQKAEIRNVGFSKVVATGKVVELSPLLSRKSLFVESPTDQQDRRVRDVRIELDNPAGLLFNSRVECTIFIKPE